MSTATIVLICVLAAIAAGIAIVAGANASVAVPIAAVSIGAVAFLFLEMGSSLRWPSGSARPVGETVGSRFRSVYGIGSLERLEVISLLDSLERAEGDGRAATPVGEPTGGFRAAGSRGYQEIARLRSLSEEEFRAFVRDRVGELERRT